MPIQTHQDNRFISSLKFWDFTIIYSHYLKDMILMLVKKVQYFQVDKSKEYHLLEHYFKKKN
jgi:hypothetical protein